MSRHQRKDGDEARPMSDQTEELAKPFSVVLRQLVLSVYVPAFLMSMCQGIALLMIPLFALDLGANAGIAALIFSLRGLGNAVFDIPAGSIATRLGDKFTMAAGVAVMMVTAIVASNASSPSDLAICAFFFGAAMATWLIGRLTFITEGVDVNHRGKAIATMAGLQRLGNFLGPVISGLIATQYGFDTVFIIIAVLSLLALVLVLALVPKTHKPEHQEHESILSSVPQIIRHHRRTFATAGLAMLMLTMLRASRQLLIPLWGESIGLDIAQIGYIVGAASAVDMCLFPLAGYVMDNIGRKPAALSCLLVISVGLAAIPFTGSALTLAMAALVIGFGNGLGSGINMTLGADLSPANNRGEFLGVWRLMSDTGSFGGPVLIGVVVESLTLSSAFFLTGVAGLIGLAVLQLVRETKPEKTSEQNN